MNNKPKIILISVLLVAIVLLIVFWILSRQDNEDEVILPDIIDQNQDVQPELNSSSKPQVTQPQISEEDKLKAQLQKLSNSFIERYGSYSNQSDFENLEDLMPFMASNLKFKTENFIADKRAQGNYADIYYGITTKVLNTQIIDFSPEISRAKFKISTQRQELVGSTSNANVYYQDVDIELIKEGGVWKVNLVEWL